MIEKYKNLYENEKLEPIKLIGDLDELVSFLDKIIVPFDVNIHTLYFSLAARRKYISDEQKLLLKYNKENMFAKNIISASDKEGLVSKFVRNLRRCECNPYGYTCRTTGFPFPNNCLVVYVNINPTNAIKVAKAINKRFIDTYASSAQIMYNGSDISNPLFEMRNIVDFSYIEYSKTENSDHFYYDIDVDIETDYLNLNNKKELVSVFYEMLKKFNVDFNFEDILVVDTAGGYHIITPVSLQSALKMGKGRLVELYKKELYDKDYFKLTKEVTLSKNNMAPCPGTYQNNYLVTCKSLLEFLR